MSDIIIVLLLTINEDSIDLYVCILAYDSMHGYLEDLDMNEE